MNDEVRLVGFKDKKQNKYLCNMCNEKVKESELRRIALKGSDVRQSRIWACVDCRSKLVKNGWVSE